MTLNARCVAVQGIGYTKRLVSIQGLDAIKVYIVDSGSYFNHAPVHQNVRASIFLQAGVNLSMLPHFVAIPDASTIGLKVDIVGRGTHVDPNLDARRLNNVQLLNIIKSIL